MGHGSADPAAWANYKATNVTGKTQAQLFSQHSMIDALDPSKFALRESVRSADNPRPTPIILASDVTGSMGYLAHELMKGGLEAVIREIYDHKPVSDPHIAVMGVGDAKCDAAPLQVTQFEADIVLADQVKQIWLEGGGGGNGGESYSLAHLFAGLKTRLDSEVDGRKGYLFTIGDEPIHDGVTKYEAKKVLGLDLERDLSAADCLALARRKFHVFHLHTPRHVSNTICDTWTRLMPENLVSVSDVSTLGEIIGGIIRRFEGESLASVVSSHSGSTAVAVANAIGGLPVAADQGGGTGIVELA